MGEGGREGRRKGEREKDKEKRKESASFLRNLNYFNKGATKDDAHPPTFPYCHK